MSLDAWEQAQVDEGKCPWSGGRLVRRDDFDGRTAERGNVFSCGICDCFGFNPDELGRVTFVPAPTSQEMT